ncbi:MAG: hypothetical protein ACKO6N_09255 [Myxococcota bacterium]
MNGNSDGVETVTRACGKCGPGRTRRGSWGLMGLWLLGGFPACGPSATDFVGQYDVLAAESITGCDRSTPRPSLLSDVSRVKISEGDYWDLFVQVGDCQLKANLSEQEEGVFTVQEQSCGGISLDDSSAQVTVEGVGSVVENLLAVEVSGTYEGTDSFGYPVTCSYRLSLATQETE